MISIVLCTKRREPKFDWFADSLVKAMAFAPSADVEVIVVDGCLAEERGSNPTAWIACEWRRVQLDLAFKSRFPYRHVQPKPTAWQGPYRKTKRDWYDLNNARNTGIALARGNHIALVDDCSLLDENWLHYQQLIASRAACAGSFKSYNKAQVANGKIIEGELHPLGNDSRGEMTRRAPGGWLWGLNASFPLEWAIKINGYDEMYAGQGGSEDCDFGVRLERAGCPIVYEPRCLIYQILETHEAVCEIATWGREQKTPQKEKLLRDGKMHFANELLIQELLDDSTRVLPRGNDFVLGALARHALASGAFPTERKVTHDWRDGKSLGDM